jgi:pyruvate/2-oxoglutarate dehydrogenase complex dihydrolipoamide acyltransferase (E2) component
MATIVAMPKMGLSMKTGTVGKWLVNEGDTVTKGQPLAEVMTDKITNKCEATADGILLKIVAAKGAKLPVLGLMGVIGEAGEDITEVLASAPAAEAPAANAAAAGGGDGREATRLYLMKECAELLAITWQTAGQHVPRLPRMSALICLLCWLFVNQ